MAQLIEAKELFGSRATAANLHLLSQVGRWPGFEDVTLATVERMLSTHRHMLAAKRRRDRQVNPEFEAAVVGHVCFTMARAVQQRVRESLDDDDTSDDDAAAEPSPSKAPQSVSSTAVRVYEALTEAAKLLRGTPRFSGDERVKKLQLTNAWVRTVLERAAFSATPATGVMSRVPTPVVGAASDAKALAAVRIVQDAIVSQGTPDALVFDVRSTAVTVCNFSVSRCVASVDERLGWSPRVVAAWVRFCARV
jgi:hypothetical protein